MDSSRISSDRPFSDNEKTTLLPQEVGRKRSFSFSRKTRKRHVIRLLGNLFLPRIFHDVNRARVCGTHPLVHPSAFIFAFLPSSISSSRTEEHDCLIFPRRGISYSFSRAISRRCLTRPWYDIARNVISYVNRLEILANVFVYIYIFEDTIFYFFPLEASSASLDREKGMIPRRRSNGPKERERRRRRDSSE